MRTRPTRNRSPENVRPQLEKLSSDLVQIQHLLQDELYQARSVLAELTPTLSEMLAQVAKQARESGREIKALVDSGNHDDVREDATEQLADAEALNNAIEQVREVLRHDANEQNVLSEADYFL